MIPIQTLVVSEPGKGGANEKIAGQNLSDNQSAPPDASTRPLLNCHTNTIGSIVKRSGYSVYKAPIVIDGSPDITLTKILGMAEYSKFSGTTYDVVVASNGSSVKVIDLSTPASPVDITDPAGSEAAISITDDSQIDFAVVADTLIATTSNRDEPFKWTGSGGCSRVTGSPPNGKYVEEFFNYCFIANTSANPERVYWSALFDITSWTGTDFKRLEDSCTGMAKRGEVLFLFTKNSIWTCQYTGDSVVPFQFDQIDSRVGCIANKTIVNIEGVLHWLSGDGHIYRMAGFKPERVTEAIPQTIADLNLGAFGIAFAVDQKELRQYWCFVPKDVSTYCDFVIVFDYLNNSLFMFDGMDGSCAINLTSSSGAIQTYLGDRTGYIYLTNNGNSDYPGGVQTAIEFFRYSKIFDLGSPGVMKRLRRFRCTVNNGGNYSSLATIVGDFGSTGGNSLELSHNGGGDLLGITWTLGESRLGRTQDTYNLDDLATNCRYLQIKFSNNAYDQPVEIRDFELAFQAYDQKRWK